MITQTRTFRAIAEAVAPAVQRLDEAGWHSAIEIIEQAIAQRPPSVRRQLTLFIRILNLLSISLYGRSLARLPIATRARFLGRIETSRLLLMRRGFWGLRTLIFMGYYARPEAKAEIGYRGHPLGWQARR
jgi:hypothetical protein